MIYDPGTIKLSKFLMIFANFQRAIILKSLKTLTRQEVLWSINMVHHMKGGGGVTQLFIIMGLFEVFNKLLWNDIFHVCFRVHPLAQTTWIFIASI